LGDERGPGQLATGVVGGYRLLTDPWQITWEARLQNLFDRRQPDNLRINASGRRYYEPAPGFDAFAGLEILHAFRRTRTPGR